MSSFDSRPAKNKTYSSIKFQTLSLPCFNKYRELFYNSEGVKIIPSDLENLLTHVSLAYWIMDDGYGSGKGFYICTESYSFIEHKLLVKIMKKKFNLDCGIHKITNGNRLYFYGSSKEKLKVLTMPYLLSHFQYKFETNVKLKQEGFTDNNK